MACLAAAAIILWSIVPRRERFVATGPRLTPESDPRLFEEIFRIARKLDQMAPTEAYLSLGVDAWVGGRGGFMGIGSRRVVGVGLTLLGTLSVSEFRAALDHEFGHFRRGDTRLGPWRRTGRPFVYHAADGVEGGGGQRVQVGGGGG